jgi:RNA polymerase sigma factor (TIGR02999 family)
MTTKELMPALALPAISIETSFARNYQRLREIARARLRRTDGITLLDTSALVHELFEKIGKSPVKQFESDQHFLAYSSSAMRTLVIDFIRARNALHRGGLAVKQVLETELAAFGPNDDAGLIALDAALDALQLAEPRLAEVVTLRFFGGFTEEEIATAQGISSRTVKRDWEKARLLLAAMLAP